MKGTVILLLALGALGACAPGQHQARHDALVDSSKVTVSVENGVVTVAGEVENWEVYNAVLERVFSTLPYGVINQLQRRKTPPPLGPK